jgi:cell division protein FtsB
LRQEAPARPDSLRAVLGAAVLFFSVLLVFASVKSHRDLAAARGHQRDLERTIHDTRERIETLRGRIDRLRRDPDTLERLAREELGMVRPTDVVIVLPAPAPPPPAPPPLAVQARLAAPVAGAAPLPGAAPVASAAQAAAKAAPAPRRAPAAAPQLTPAAPR